MEKKTGEQMFEERTGNNLLNFIAAKTYVRHSKLSEQDFLKEIGFEETGKSEDEAINIAKMNVYIETTNRLFNIINTIKIATELLKVCLIDEKKEKQKGE